MAVTVFMLQAVFFLYIFQCYAEDIIVTFRLKEELSNHTLIGNIADESDLASKFPSVAIADLQFNILEQSSDPLTKELFHITVKGGYLFTAKIINRDILKECEYVEHCIVEFDVAAQSSSAVKIINVKVEIEDTNDNEPHFSVDLIKQNLSEGVSVGTEIPIQAAEDEDIGINTIQTYRIWPSNNHFHLKEEKNLDGRSTILNLVVNQSLDREVEDFHEIQILAEDGGTPLRTGTLTVQITVLDENDERPMFTNSTRNITVPEDITVNTPIIKVTAYDQDLGKNGQIFYRFAARQKEDVYTHFSIHETTGEITLIKQLVYQPGLNYKIYVEASDRGDQPLFAQTVVDVYILDSANNQPQIQLSFLTPITSPNTIEISEGTEVGFSFAIIDVEDTDTGRNGNVTCSTFSTYFGLMLLGKNRYTVALQHSLNREDVKKHNMSVTCKDQGIPVLKSTVDFTIHVTDENDEPPIFSEYVYSASVMENSPNGTFVTRVTATDRDIGENGRIRFAISPSSDSRFTVDPVNGIVQTSVPFDRELSSHITVVITASDNGINPMTSSATVLLDILDENDNFPEFVSLIFPFQFQENLHSGNFVGEVTANDNDKGQNGQIMYSISPEDKDNVPFVVLENGEIKNNRALNREIQNRYDFTVSASDGGEPSKNSSAHVTVFITDVNDHAPRIIFPKKPNDTVVIPHVTLPNIVIASVVAYDDDSEENADLEYSIIDGNSENIFSIDHEEGNIFLSKKIELSGDEKYTLTIAVDDKGIPTHRSIEVLNIVLKYTNVTTVLESEGTTGQNVLIAVVVVCLTVVLSIVMIAVICVIRRCDNKKVEELSPCYYDEAGQGENIHLSISKSQISHVQFQPDKMYMDKSKKKEVSFSFNDLDKNLNVEIPPEKPPRYCAIAEKSNKPSSILRAASHSSTHDSTNKQNAAPEDSPSETSGETITSGDSGHCGSEIGDHGNAGQRSFEINPMPHSEKELPSIYVIRAQNSHRQDSLVSRSARNTENPPILETRAHLRNNDYPEDPLLSSQNSGWSVSSHGSHHELDNSHNNAKSWTHLYLHKHSDNNFPIVHSVSMYSPINHLYKTEDIPLDNSMQSREDDEVTTTSGSYTINPDDLNDSFSPQDLYV